MAEAVEEEAEAEAEVEGVAVVVVGAEVEAVAAVPSRRLRRPQRAQLERQEPERA